MTKYIDRNVLGLATAQALAGANSSVVYATGAIIGHMLAPAPSLATLPISVFVAGMAVATLPTGVVARRYGRHAAFLFGNVCGVLVGLLSAAAIWLSSFWLFCIAMIFGGAYAAVVLTFRFAVAECVVPENRARALSTVMAGGVLAGVLGPQLATATMNLWAPYTYAVTYISAAGVSILSATILKRVRFQSQKRELVSDGRRTGEILRQPKLVAAMMCGIVSYMLMNFLMTSAPLAMNLCGIDRRVANLGIQWHIIAMYAPSFVTGRLIRRFGASRIVLIGLSSILIAALVGYQGDDTVHFWTTLVILGIGWNFGFLGASAMVLECHQPEERTRVQSINDFVVFGCMVAGSFLSGGLLARYGWETVCLVAIPPILLGILTILIFPMLDGRSYDRKTT